MTRMAGPTCDCGWSGRTTPPRAWLGWARRWRCSSRLSCGSRSWSSPAARWPGTASPPRGLTPPAWRLAAARLGGSTRRMGDGSLPAPADQAADPDQVLDLALALVGEESEDLEVHAFSVLSRALSALPTAYRSNLTPSVNNAGAQKRAPRRCAPGPVRWSEPD